MARTDLVQHQERAAVGLLRHASKTVPFYRDRLSSVVKTDGKIDLAGWRDVPFLSRADVRENTATILSTAVPSSHGKPVRFSSSGTTGSAMVGQTSEFGALQSAIAQARGRGWSDIDYSLVRVQIAPAIGGENTSFPGLSLDRSWAPPWTGLESGAWHQLDHVTPHKTQLEWLSQKGRCNLTIMPTSGVRLAELVMSGGPRPDISAIYSFGEVVTDAYRELADAAFRCKVWNEYASEEFGCIACQCPTGTEMLLNEDRLIVEILDEHDRPCRPGQPGEIVLTDLFNYRMPLIRYRMGDIGVPGKPSSCGRGLGTLESIEGRMREVFYFDDGDSFIPGIIASVLLKFLGAESYQIAQVDFDRIEIRFVSRTPEAEQDRAGFEAVVNARFQRPMNLIFKQMDKIPGADKPKFAYHVCELPADVRGGPPARVMP